MKNNMKDTVLGIVTIFIIVAFCIISFQEGKSIGEQKCRIVKEYTTVEVPSNKPIEVNTEVFEKIPYFATCSIFETESHSDHMGKHTRTVFTSGDSIFKKYPAIYITIEDSMHNEFFEADVGDEYALSLIKIKEYENLLKVKIHDPKN